MKAVLQRVQHGKVTVNQQTAGEIGPGLVILLGVAPEDTPAIAEKMADKIATLRIFEDAAEKMNLSLLDIGGAALVVSQFTLYADCRRGRRPSFTGAGSPEMAEPLVEAFAQMLQDRGIPTQKGVFGAHMQVEIFNDGPVTILLEMDSA
jgi:D-tyrosyl-tRNA(Tyr) deacylase